jgi:phosphoribosylformylglycinamidine synthase subunit I (EC 6.3.5.3)
MRACVIVYPGSNCDRDAADALRRVCGIEPLLVWHQETAAPDADLYVLPGGFSYGDYLRCGAMAALSPITAAVKARADEGRFVLGICNGFQILTEAGMLPGALLRNAGMRFICAPVALEIANPHTAFTQSYALGARPVLPVAHADGNYAADDETLARLEGEGRIAFRYATPINGAQHRIAGITNARGNVLGLMPHPERAVDAQARRTDGIALFQSLLARIG